MATVFMKWLETSPRDYDRGIQILTLGRMGGLLEKIAEQCIQSAAQRPQRVLDIGCGTGTLAILMAKRGAQVTAIDVSPLMLAEARRKAKEAGLEDAIEFHRLDVTELGDRFAPASFDVIVSTLGFSEFPSEVWRYALREAARLLRPEGQVLIADEVAPEGTWARLAYRWVRIPLLILTWLLTRTSTTPLRDLSGTLIDAGFIPTVVESRLGGSLQLVSARPSGVPEPTRTLWKACPRLRHRATVKTLLLDLWSFTNRIVPPYAKAATGLYRIGYPDRQSPVLVTGNYDLTVRRLVRELDEQVDCWLVVANSRGINVWCGAGGGHFTADDVSSALRTSGVMDAVDHRDLILPQLCANGVDGRQIERQTGWTVHWGPVRAGDIPAYLAAGQERTETMRRVQFPVTARLEMTTAMLIFYGLFVGVLGLIFWRPHTLTVLGATALMSYFYGLALPWLPGRDGLAKGSVLAAATLLALWSWSFCWAHLPAQSLLNWSLGLGYLAFFVGGEFQGMSPLMRGEQANWTIEGLAGLATLALYGAGRLVLGG